jgi:MFS family permease
MLINRNYTWLWAGKAVSLTGDLLFDTTVALWIATELLAGSPHAPLATGAVLAAVSLSVLLVGPIAGVLVDRWADKHRILLRADLIRAALAGTLALLVGLPLATPVLLAAIGVVVVASTATAQFFNAARFVMITDVVPAPHRGRAAGYSQATAVLAGLIGPPLAGPMLFGFGPQWALAANAASFVISWLAVRAVRVPARVAEPKPAPRPAGTRTGTDFWAGLRLVGGQPVLRALLVAQVVGVLGAGAVGALDVYFLAQNLQADPRTWFGVLGAVLAAGAFTGGLLGGRLADRFGAARVYAVAMLVNGCLLLGYSRMTAVWPALLVAFAETCTVGILATSAMPVFQRLVPREYQGRIASVMTLSFHLPALIAKLLAGTLVSGPLLGLDTTVLGLRLRPIDTVLGGAAVLILAAAAYARRALLPTAPGSGGARTG